MEKKKYLKPKLDAEMFVPNEYVAACEHTEDGAGMYKFVCDAGNGTYGDLFLENGTNLTEGRSSRYHACGESHNAPTTDSFLQGYFIPNGGNDKVEGYTKIPVVIWDEQQKGWLGVRHNYHATTNLHQDTWQKNHS